MEQLTYQQKAEASQLKESYCNFWKSAKFTRGWAQPLFSREEVEHLLDEVAEIVVRIKSKVKGTNPSITLMEGNGLEYLWRISKNPLKDPKSFVRGLVHSTFMVIILQFL